ncbi:sugar phosphate isomerase/epimerase family protein [Donghicola mangrovi]|uniref:Sugar phosphate isomerase/epimerase n=1 Tax=Donghicola mangrovi TaxID=2729614 RepID=A0A850QAT2_9RHOB|nr:sugar phosphate isomerase/epimerase [Donghicola mangrovi]NVO24058.1 sugar phosphate isomerase/epimerase [Donghicola mangrovi]
MNRPLSIAHLSAIELAPPALIHAAAEAGLDAVGLRLIKVTEDSPGYPLWQDPAMMQATKDALRQTGLRVNDIEFVKVTEETTAESLLPFFDAGAELGAKTAILAPYDPDLSRLADTIGSLSDAAAERGLGVVLEFFPWTSVPDLATCLKVVEQAGDAVGVLVDSLHFDRSGSGLDQLRTVPAARMPFVHLCDAPVQDSYTTEELLHTARGERFAPGDGQIDLEAFLRACPEGVPIGLEIPRPKAMSRDERIQAFADYVAKTRNLLSQIG